MLLQGITYNTTMGLVVGLIMLMIPIFMRATSRRDVTTVAGFGWAFIFLGAFLGITGIHMMLTWPLQQIDGAFCCRVDNVTFGEPAAYYGLLTFIAGLAILRAEDRAERAIREFNAVTTLRPMLYAAAAGGFGLILFAIAGMHFGQWRPPSIEPIARMWSGKMIEPFMVFSMYLGTGLTAMFSPFALTNRTARQIFIVFSIFFGAMWVVLGLSLFYGHVGFFPYAFNGTEQYPVRH